VLGSFLAQIAAEKAAIIRAGTAFSAGQAPEAMHVIEGRAAAVGIPLVREGRELTVCVRDRGLHGQRIDCAGPGWALTDLGLALLGTFQPSNALLAVATAHHLGVPDAAIRAGLGRVRWPGRFDVIEGDPRLVLDGAHNPGGARALAESLRALFSRERLTLVIGASRDKDLPGILAPLVPLADRVILTGSSSPRAADPGALRAALPPTEAAVETTRSAAEALALALDTRRTRIVCVAGSLFLVGDVLAELAGTRDSPCSIENLADSMDSLF
jgi:dihydrofolate synthase/folylpolyglutamate synthase